MQTTFTDSTHQTVSPIAHGVIALAGLFVALVAILHAVQPELEPSSHMLSEYALGRSGWLMTGAFYALAASYLGLLFLLRSQLKGLAGALGLALLFLAALGAAMGGLFPMDAVNTPADQGTRSGMLHGIGALLGIPGLLLGATIINLSLARRPQWQSARRALLWTTVTLWVTFAIFAASMVLLVSGSVTANLIVGWQNRVMMLTHVGWVVFLAWRVWHLRR